MKYIDVSSELENVVNDNDCKYISKTNDLKVTDETNKTYKISLYKEVDNKTNKLNSSKYFQKEDNTDGNKYK